MTPPASTSKLTDHLGYWLRLVSNQVSTSFARRVAAEEVTVAEWVVLRALFDTDGVAPSKLASGLGMTRGAISKLADRLVAKGLVAATENPDDGRAHTLTLSKSGRRLVPRIAALADDNDAAFFDVLSSRERQALRQILEKLASHHAMSQAPID